jgi:Helix-turn-helix
MPLCLSILRTYRLVCPPGLHTASCIILAAARARMPRCVRVISFHVGTFSCLQPSCISGNDKRARLPSCWLAVRYMMHRLKSFLRPFRRRFGFTQRELAFLIGIQSRGAVSRFERAIRKPTFEVLSKSRSHRVEGMPGNSWLSQWLLPRPLSLSQARPTPAGRSATSGAPRPLGLTALARRAAQLAT